MYIKDTFDPHTEQKYLVHSGDDLYEVNVSLLCQRTSVDLTGDQLAKTVPVDHEKTMKQYHTRVQIVQENGKRSYFDETMTDSSDSRLSNEHKSYFFMPSNRS